MNRCEETVCTCTAGKKDFCLIPEPQKMEYAEGSLKIANLTKIVYNGEEDAAFKELKTRFAGAEWEIGKDGYSLTVFDKDMIPAQECPDKPDAYVMKADERGIRIDALTQAGLFYGIKTLFQLPSEIGELYIEDYAAIPIRMLHWDLKGYQPHYDVLLEEMDIIASYKVNSILLEIEDKYDYKCAPGIGIAEAYTYDEFRKLSVYAKERHIMIVPKLQSIAHVDYVLKQDRYRHLREPGHVFQYCCTNKEVQELWEAMCDELMDCFREHGPYFHIGADEPENLGECPECSKLGKAGSYQYKVGLCVDYVKAKGWIPVMWDDIIRNEYNTFTEEEEKQLWERFREDAVIMYWAYGYGGKRNELPYTEKYLDMGMKTWGASGYAGCDNWAGSIPPMEYRALNIDAWTKKAKERQLECVCATGWGRIGSADCPAEPIESCWFTVLYAAYSMWSGKEMDYRVFEQKLSVLFYGKEADEKLLNTLFNIDKSPYDIFEQDKLEEITQGMNKRMKFLVYAASLESFSVKPEGRLYNYFRYYDSKLGKKLEDYRLKLLKNYAVSLAESTKLYKDAVEDIYSQFYKKQTVDDVLSSRIGLHEKMLKEMQRLLSETEEA